MLYRCQTLLPKFSFAWTRIVWMVHPPKPSSFVPPYAKQQYGHIATITPRNITFAVVYRYHPTVFNWEHAINCDHDEHRYLQSMETQAWGTALRITPNNAKRISSLVLRNKLCLQCPSAWEVVSRPSTVSNSSVEIWLQFCYLSRILNRVHNI